MLVLYKNQKMVNQVYHYISLFDFIHVDRLLHTKIYKISGNVNHVEEQNLVIFIYISLKHYKVQN